MLRIKDMHIFWNHRICADISGIRRQGVGQKVWINYLFWNLDHSPTIMAYDTRTLHLV